MLRARMPTRLGWGNQRFEDSPLSIGQITGIGFAAHSNFRIGVSSLDGEEPEDDTDLCFYYTTLHTPSELDFVQFGGKNWAWKLREVR